MKTDFADEMKNQGIKTPQTKPFGGATFKNEAGGYNFPTDVFENLKRFLILGADTQTFYVNKATQIDRFLDTVKEAVDADPLAVISLAVHASENAPRIGPAIFALAVATTSKDEQARSAALRSIPDVCRIPTHYFIMARYIRKLRGWSPQVSRAFNEYYLKTPHSKLAFHAIKYKQREGFSHRDLLRLCHPKAPDKDRNDIFKFMVSGDLPDEFDPDIFSYIVGSKLIFEEESLQKALGLIKKYRLTEEMIPDRFKTREVWGVLAPNMGQQAFLRNIVRMASHKYLDVGMWGSEGLAVFLDKFSDQHIKRSRLHPIDFLKAYAAYQGGEFEGLGNNYEFNVHPKIKSTLWNGIYKSIGNVKPTGKTLCLAYDHSGSMEFPVDFAGVTMAPSIMQVILGQLYTKTEANTFSVSFGTSLMKQAFDENSSFDEISNAIPKKGEGTDCALPVKYLLQNNIMVDALIEFTDQMSWFGKGHTQAWIEEYRDRMNPDFRFVVFQMAPYESSIVDPKDPKSLGVVGLDASAFDLVSSFIRGELDG